MIDDLPDFSGSRRAALASLRTMERKFESDRDLKSKYCAFMREYAAVGHMEPAQNMREDACYLPHHGVHRATDEANKL